MLLQQPLPFTVLKLATKYPTMEGSGSWLQQPLPFTVLKLYYFLLSVDFYCVYVATALTVYGIETMGIIKPLYKFMGVATALTVYGIETLLS